MNGWKWQLKVRLEDAATIYLTFCMYYFGQENFISYHEKVRGNFKK